MLEVNNHIPRIELYPAQPAVGTVIALHGLIKYLIMVST